MKRTPEQRRANYEARKRYLARLRNDPVAYTEFRAKEKLAKRKYQARRRAELKTNPEKWTHYLKRVREWNKHKRDKWTPEQRTKASANTKRWRDENPEKYKAALIGYRARAAIKRRLLREEVIHAYGGECICCSESEIRFLHIDHINGDGAIHRKQTGLRGQGLMNHLKKAKYPSGYRVLCANCHNAISFYDGCPHGLPSNKKKVIT